MVETNKQGQALGRKGAETRLRLMDAARHLLRKQSPIQLTAVAIAKQARTSSATFYMYFDDVPDIMYALSEHACKDLDEVYAVLDEPWDPNTPDLKHARRLVESVFSFWERHREVLRYRNLEADRGDLRFRELKTRYHTPILEKISNIILAGYPPGARPSRGSAYADAAVVQVALDGIAASNLAILEQTLGIARMKDALTRVTAHVLGGRSNDETWSETGAGGSATPPSRPSAPQRKKRAASGKGRGTL